jgi:catechol 2,3-dioxygenase-like lactoylglutathione lyase family enzyme
VLVAVPGTGGGVIGLDHVALPTADGARLASFYRSLGFQLQRFDAWEAGRAVGFAIVMGDQKVNVHPETITPERRRSPGFLGCAVAVPGCGDLCVVWSGGPDTILELLAHLGIVVEAGPVARLGGRAHSSMEGMSVYVRDPDNNLLEFICYP